MLPESVAPPTAPSPNRGLAIAALILGAVSVVLSFLLIGGAVALVGVVLACIHLWRGRQPRNIAVGGFVLSAFGLAATMAWPWGEAYPALAAGKPSSGATYVRHERCAQSLSCATVSYSLAPTEAVCCATHATAALK